MKVTSKDQSGIENRREELLFRWMAVCTIVGTASIVFQAFTDPGPSQHFAAGVTVAASLGFAILVTLRNLVLRIPRTGAYDTKIGILAIGYLFVMLIGFLFVWNDRETLPEGNKRAD